MNKPVHLLRTALCVTQHCTLNCELCLVFIPYFDKPQNVTLNEAKLIFKEYFSIVDTVDIFTVTGGEPLLNPDLISIFQELLLYSKQIVKSIDFVTNGTLQIPEDLLRLFADNQNKIRVIISDYGELSYRIKEIVETLEASEITYRVSNFHGEDLYFDGWIDFRDHSLKSFTQEERDAKGKQCVHRLGRYFVINSGELHGCSRAFWRMKNGIIPYVREEYVDLLSDDLTSEEKKAVVRNMIEITSTISCGHCVGLINGTPRHYPARQLETIQLPTIEDAKESDL